MDSLFRARKHSTVLERCGRKVDQVDFLGIIKVKNFCCVSKEGALLDLERDS